MVTKDVLMHGGNVVPEINDSSTTKFGDYEVYSRKRTDELLASAMLMLGYDWAGKTIIVEGDSVSTCGLVAHLNNKLRCNAVLHGISGLPVYGATDGSATDFRSRISAYPPNADAIIILGDVNATASVAGSANVCGTLDSSGVTTWFGRYNEALEGLKKSFPTVPIFLVAEFGMAKSKQKTTYNVATFYHQLARKWSCIYVDLTTECSLDLRYGHPVWGNTPTDSVHPSAEAMELAADVIVRRIKQIPPFRFAGHDTIAIDSAVTVAAGETVELTATKTGDLSTKWESSDTAIATVLGGKVWGMAAGTATITATTRNGNTATCTVTVTEAAAE